MFCDIADLRDFYETKLGRVSKVLLRRRLHRIWPDVSGLVVLGIGYPVPLLRPYQSRADRVAVLMPAQQGVVYWPREGPNRALLSYEESIPLADCSVDRIIMMHALECTDNLKAMLREVWRVLAANGRLLVIVPNRRGIWAQREKLPFSQGQSYTMGQLKRQLRAHQFTPLRFDHALFVPPFGENFSLRGAAVWEKMGARWCHSLSGVLLVEASKEVLSGIRVRKLSPAVLGRNHKAHQPILPFTYTER
jgi:SAM-dependent methyltransferase